MDLDLNSLGTASEQLDAVEAALAEEAFTQARDALDAADEALERVRGQWRELPARERRLLATMATPVSQRRAALAKRVPALRAVSEGPAEPDADDGDEPPS